MTRCRNCSNPSDSSVARNSSCPSKNDLYERSTLELEVRQHAEFFDRLRRQVLRFVDDQQHALVFARAVQEELFEIPQKHRFARGIRAQTELKGNQRK